MTRMGLHCNSGRGLGRAADFARDTQPAAMKFLVLNRAVLERIRRESPGTKIVYRHYWGDQIIGDSGQRQRFTNAVLNVVREYDGLIDYFEGWNEAVATSTTPSILRQFCGEELDFARRVNDAGGGAAIGGFSTGAWDFEQDGSKMFAAALPMLSYLNDTGDRNALHFHEYGGTYMAWGVRTPDGLNQWDWNGNRPTALGGPHLYDPGLDGWWCLRYRMARRRLVSAGLTGVKFLITEAGLDDVSPRPGGHGKGWRDWTADEWTNIQGDYAAQWQWYMWHISHDPYVIGAVDFGFGTEDPTWNSFDLYQTPAMLERMASHQVALPVGYIGEEPVEPEEPMIELVDVSQHQGVIDWAKMKAKGVKGAWIRAGGGLARAYRTGEVDSMFAGNVYGAESVGIPWGPYWWYANDLDGAAQSEAFAHVVGNWRFKLPPLADWELGGTLIEHHMLRAMEFCEARLGRPLCYTSFGWAKANKLGNYKWLRDYPLHLARYTSASTTDAPAPWSDWTVWQWSAGGNGQASAYGAQGKDLDLNRYRGTIEQLMALHAAPVVGDPVLSALHEWAKVAQAIEPNPTGALYKAIAGDGFYLLSDESGARGVVPTVPGYPNVSAQLARKIGGNEERIYFVIDKDWAHIQWTNR